MHTGTYCTYISVSPVTGSLAGLCSRCMMVMNLNFQYCTKTDLDHQLPVWKQYLTVWISLMGKREMRLKASVGPIFIVSVKKKSAYQQ